MPIFGGVRRVRLRPATTPAVYRFERLSAQANAFFGGVTTGCPVASAPPQSSAAGWPTAASRLRRFVPLSGNVSGVGREKCGTRERRRKESARPQLVAGTIRALTSNCRRGRPAGVSRAKASRALSPARRRFPQRLAKSIQPPVGAGPVDAAAADADPLRGRASDRGIASCAPCHNQRVFFRKPRAKARVLCLAEYFDTNSFDVGPGFRWNGDSRIDLQRNRKSPAAKR